MEAGRLCAHVNGQIQPIPSPYKTLNLVETENKFNSFLDAETPICNALKGRKNQIHLQILFS